jgi:uncharacterized protein YbjQ (UPF0145 family)
MAHRTRLSVAAAAVKRESGSRAVFLLAPQRLTKARSVLLSRAAPVIHLSFPMMVSTTNDITGFKIVRHLGIVRGITVRSRSVVGNLVGGLQSMFGGQIGAYLDLAETSRQEAFDHMCAHATQAGANAVVGMRYDANEIMDGITEVLAYGTAVWVEPLAR